MDVADTQEIDIRVAKEVAIRAAKEGGKALLQVYQQGVYSTREKEDTSLQTEADLLAERTIIQCLQEAFPKHSIESEEEGRIGNASSPYRWKIDPLDGTENFVLGLPYFSSTLTFYYLHRPLLAVVYEPVTQKLYTAEREQGALLGNVSLRVSQTNALKGCRVFLIPDFVTKRLPQTIALRQQLHLYSRRVLDTWSPALDWCLVASGKADAVIAIASEPILPDAGTLLLEEAGGRITDFEGNPFHGEEQCCLIGSNNTALHDHLLQLTESFYREKEHGWKHDDRSYTVGHRSRARFRD